MSESSQHRNLVQALTSVIIGDSLWKASPIVYSDVLDGSGANLPPTIGGYRPDIFARDLTTSFSVIGEAKTPDDIDNRHTNDQLASYFEYLCGQPYGELWLGVPWLSAGTATRISAHIRKRSNAQHIPIRVAAFMFGSTSHRRIWRE